MIQDIKDEILESSPSYTIRDKNGNVTQDDADIALKTPLIQEGTPINAGLLKNIQGDLYTQSSYNEFEAENIELQEISYSGTGISSSSHPYYLAFDKKEGTYWNSNTIEVGEFARICVVLTKPISVKQVKITALQNTTTPFFLQASTDNETWVDIAELSFANPAVTKIIDVDNENEYNYYGIKGINNGTASTVIRVYEFEITKWEEDGAEKTGEYITTFGSRTEPFYTCVFTSNMPLTSYEKGKIVNITGPKIPINEERINQTDIIPKSWTKKADLTYQSSNGIILTGSADASSWSMTKAFDGDSEDTYWYDTSSKAGELRLQFPEKVKITGMNVVSYKNYEIQVSNNGIEWKTWNTNKDYYYYYRLKFEEGKEASCYEWSVTEWAEPLGYIPAFRNPALDINGLGRRWVNGTIQCGVNHTLIFNGENWDVCTPPIIGTASVGNVSGTNVYIPVYGAKFVVIDDEHDSSNGSFGARILLRGEGRKTLGYSSSAYTDGELNYNGELLKLHNNYASDDAIIKYVIFY